MTPGHLLDEARRFIKAEGQVPIAWLARLSAAEQKALQDALAQWLTEDARRNPIEYYRPVSPAAERVHLSCAREIGVQGGRRAGKTGTLLAEAVMQATGIVPRSLAGRYPPAKLRGLKHPIRVRIVVTSLENAWDINLKQKLQWFEWNGKLNKRSMPGDPTLGHWGWIPQSWLIHGDWDQSWSEKHRTLTLWHPGRRETWSTFQVISHNQSIKEFQQGAYHLVIEDELPYEEIHRANRLRVMEMSGQIIVGGTPPDDRTGAVGAAWFFDQVVTPGLEQSDPAAVDAIVLPTDENRTLAASDVAHVTRGLTDEQRRAVLRGEGIHLAGLIVKGFTVYPKWWCFRCVKTTLVVGDDGVCAECDGKELVRYRHVFDEEDLPWPGPPDWPVLFYADPHQSRPTACAWYKVDPADQIWQLADAEIAGDASVVKREVERFEAEHGFRVTWRKMDPKITAQQNQFAREFEGQPFTIRRAFEEVGFDFEDANTNFTVAINRIEQWLRPNPWTKAPRLRVHTSCERTIYHLTHNVWQGARREEQRETKEQPGKRWSDFVAVTRYCAMDDPEFRVCQTYGHRATISLTAPSRVGRNRATGW